MPYNLEVLKMIVKTDEPFQKPFAPLKNIEIIVYIRGNRIIYDSLYIQQAFNSSHQVEIVQRFLGREPFLLQNTPEKFSEDLGNPIDILFKEGDYTHQFRGYITEVQIDTSKHTCLKYKGKGVLCRLEGIPTMATFTKMNLNNIVTDITRDHTKYFCIEINSKYKSKLPFILQYKENSFEFINRLSAIFNEIFFYDGETLFFGEPTKKEEIKLFFDEDITDFRTFIRDLPLPDRQYCFESTEAVSLLAKIQRSIYRNIPILNPIIQTKRIEWLPHQKQNITSSTFPVEDEAELMDILHRQRNATLGKMHLIEGKTKNPRLKLGGLIYISFPEKIPIQQGLGTYRIISIEHIVEKEGSYYNHFVAVPMGLEFSLAQPTTIAYPEMAKVVDNKDPKRQGRVRVQFPWNEEDTNWIRVQTPDTGGITNGGFLFVPQVGDQVMVGFEQGDPNRPFVMGSLFHGENASQQDPSLRTITTQSGCAISFDDTQGSILIKDKAGSGILLDGKGNIEITTPNNLSFLAKTLEVKGEKMTIEEQEIQIEGQNTFELHSKNITLKGSGKLSASAQEMGLLGYSEFKVYGGKSTILGKSDIILRAPEILTSLSGYSTSTKQNTAKAKKQATQAIKGKEIKEQKLHTKSPKEIEQEKISIEQLKINFFVHFSLFIEEYINILQQWRVDLLSEREDDDVSITDAVAAIINFFDVKIELSIGINIVLGISSEISNRLKQMKEVSPAIFCQEILTLLADIKEGKDKPMRYPDRESIPEREDSFKKFLIYTQSKGATTTDGCTKCLTPFFKELKSSFLPSKFYRTLTMGWIYAARDGMDWNISDKITAGYVRIRCHKQWDKSFDLLNRKAIWVVDDFYIDDISNPKGVLALLRSKYFNNGEKSIFKIPIAIHLSLSPLRDHIHQIPIEMWRDKDYTWIQGREHFSDSLFKDFKDWMRQSNDLYLNKLNIE